MGARPLVDFLLTLNCIKRVSYAELMISCRTAEWSFRSSYEMSSVRGMTCSDVNSVFDDDGASESVVEDDEEEDQDGTGIESEPHVAESDQRFE